MMCTFTLQCTDCTFQSPWYLASAGRSLHPLHNQPLHRDLLSCDSSDCDVFFHTDCSCQCPGENQTGTSSPSSKPSSGPSTLVCPHVHPQIVMYIHTDCTLGGLLYTLVCLQCKFYIWLQWPTTNLLSSTCFCRSSPATQYLILAFSPVHKIWAVHAQHACGALEYSILPWCTSFRCSSSFQENHQLSHLSIALCLLSLLSCVYSTTSNWLFTQSIHICTICQPPAAIKIMCFPNNRAGYNQLIVWTWSMNKHSIYAIEMI